MRVHWYADFFQEIQYNTIRGWWNPWGTMDTEGGLWDLTSTDFDIHGGESEEVSWNQIYMYW